MVQQVPHFKVRISDEWGRRINSIDSPGSDFFDDTATDEQIVEEGGEEDAFGLGRLEHSANGSDDDDDNEHWQKCCSKCNHRCQTGGSEPLKLQFSSSFE